MVPWSHLRHPFSGRMWTDLTTELAHFNLVIRLRKAKQSAFSFFSLFCDFLQTLMSQCLLESSLLYLSTAVQNNQKLLFLAAASPFDVKHDMSDRRQQACPLPAGMVFLVSGEVEHIVHLIRWNLNSCVMPTWLDLTTFPAGSSARLFRKELIPINLNFSNSSPVPLCNVSWGLGVCPVLVRSVSPCRLVLEVRLFPPPLALFLAFCPSFLSAFFFLLPFRVDPAPAVCVCV